jgi:hypothetical protein
MQKIYNEFFCNNSHIFLAKFVEMVRKNCVMQANKIIS